MTTAETIIQEASALPLTEQYRIGLRLLERAQALFAESASPSAMLTDAERRAALVRESRGSMRGKLSSVEDFLKEKHAELEREQACDAARLERIAA
jgi:hypothetical protein